MKPPWGNLITTWMQRERNMENLQIFRLDPYSVRCNPAMPKGKLVFAVCTLLQIKLDSHICLYIEYAGIESRKPVGGKNEGWWERASGLTFLPFVSRMRVPPCLRRSLKITLWSSFPYFSKEVIGENRDGILQVVHPASGEAGWVCVQGV